MLTLTHFSNNSTQYVELLPLELHAVQHSTIVLCLKTLHDVETNTLTLLAVLACLLSHQSDESGDSSEDERENDKRDGNGKDGKKMIIRYK